MVSHSSSSPQRRECTAIGSSAPGTAQLLGVFVNYINDINNYIVHAVNKEVSYKPYKALYRTKHSGAAKNFLLEALAGGSPFGKRQRSFNPLEQLRRLAIRPVEVRKQDLAGASKKAGAWQTPQCAKVPGADAGQPFAVCLGGG